MAQAEAPEMSKQAFSIAYAGETQRDQHSIEVQTLSPALLAFGKLLREANAEFNGKKSTVRVLVVSDFEHKCFNINFELIISLYEQLKLFVGTDNAKSAKDVLEWIGIVGTLSGTGLSFFKFLQWQKGRKVETVKPVVDSDKNGIVEVQVHGDRNAVHVHNHVYNLANNPKALRATRDVFVPLGKEGFDRIQLKENDLVTSEIRLPEVEDIIASCNTGIEESKETEPEIEVTSAWLTVYSPVYDITALNWRFRYGKEIIYADITATDIAQQALQRGGALINDSYLVELEVTTEIDAQGNKKSPKYKILRTQKFVPQPRQASFFDDRPDGHQ